MAFIMRIYHDASSSKYQGHYYCNKQPCDLERSCSVSCSIFRGAFSKKLHGVQL